MQDLRGLYYSELEELISSLGEPKFRAKQIYKWISSGVSSMDEMTNVPVSLKAKLLDAGFGVYAPKVLSKLVSKDGTIKYLWELSDGNAVETVLMKYRTGNTVCISTQVGCRMGCRFCASTIGGLVRNLSPAEILSEVMMTEKDSGEKISKIVIMGIGEPLDNYDNVIKFLHLVNSPDGMNIGMRHITLSTCCIPDKLRRLMDENLQITLAISLHAAEDGLRTEIMPSNRACGLEVLLSLAREYYEKTGRRITFEYAMIAGVNDSLKHASLLADAALSCGAHLNLIPLNKVEESPFAPSSKKDMDAFTAVLTRRGANFTIRRSLGGDVNASCGQLRRNREKSRKTNNSSERI